MLNMKQLIEDKSGDRYYFAMLPTMLWPDIKLASSDSPSEAVRESHTQEIGVELDVYDKWLYATIKRVCGEKGGQQCFLSTTGLARLASMSEGKVSSGKQKLQAAGLITVISKKRSAKGQAIDHITVVDVWERNIATIKARQRLHHMKASPHEGKGSQGEGIPQKASPHEGKPSPHETEEEPIEEEPKGEEEINAPAAQKSPASSSESTKPNPLTFDLDRATEQAQQREGSWTAPPEAGGTNPWADGPVDAFAEVLAGIIPILLPAKERTSWARKLAQIAVKWSTEESPITPAIMEAAIRAVPDSDIGWKTYKSPYAGNFETDIGFLLLNGGRPTKKPGAPDIMAEATQMTLRRLGHGDT